MINNKDTKVSYRGNGQTTVFPFTFPFIAKEYIHVAIYDSLTQETVTLTSDYYVDAEAKTVTYPGYPPGQAPAESARPPVLPSTSTITIYRQTDINQLVDLGDKYPLPDIESMSDKLTEIIQEQAETLGRAVKVPVGNPKTPEEKLTDLQTYVKSAADSAANAARSETDAQQAAEHAATSAENAAESERLASGYADTASDAASRAEDSAISARAYNAPDYDNEITYQAGEVVTYTDGNSYRALQETTGNEPTNIIYWQKVTDYVGDDFFEVDEYGYIVPMDSPSHSRYWRVDQDDYIVPIDGGDGGYRPDTRQLSAEYLNVTNEGYVKHLRTDDVNAQDLTATGNVTAGMVTTPQANVTTLTANTANVTALTAGTLTANDIIAKGPWVDVRGFGAKGDGVTDDTSAIQAALNVGGLIIIPPGIYHINTTGLTIKSDTKILGIGSPVLTTEGNAYTDEHYKLIKTVGRTQNVYTNNIEIIGITFTMPADTFYEHIYILELFAVKNVTVKKCHFNKWFSDAICIGTKDASVSNSNIVIEDCFFDGYDNNNRNAITIADGQNIIVQRCVFKNTTRTNMPGAIDLEPDYDYQILSNIHIINNRFDNIGGNSGVIGLSTARIENSNGQYNNIYIVDNIINVANASKCSLIIDVYNNEGFYKSVDNNIVISDNVLNDGIIVIKGIKNCTVKNNKMLISQNITTSMLRVGGTSVPSTGASDGTSNTACVVNVEIMNNIFKRTNETATAFPDVGIYNAYNLILEENDISGNPDSTHRTIATYNNCAVKYLRIIRNMCEAVDPSRCGIDIKTSVDTSTLEISYNTGLRVGNTVGALINGNRYSNVAPTSGWHAVGERIYANNPSTAGTEGWICTSGGTPGTWVNMKTV